jgi:hypothetical protein
MDSFAIRSCEANGGSQKLNWRAVSFFKGATESRSVPGRRTETTHPRKAATSLFDNLQTPQGFVDLGANQHAFLDISLAL